MPILAIAGKKGAGKDTAAERLIESHKFKRIGLADPLKDMCAVVFRIDRKVFDDPKLKEAPFDRITIDYAHVDGIRVWLAENGIEVDYEMRENMEQVAFGHQVNTPRELLQFVGTDVCRNNISDRIWLDLGIDRIKMSTNDKIVITDARFPNERRELKKLGATLILINRPGLDSGDVGSSHASENSLGDESDYDVVFNNVSTAYALQSDIGLWYTLRKDQLGR